MTYDVLLPKSVTKPTIQTTTASLRMVVSTEELGTDEKAVTPN